LTDIAIGAPFEDNGAVYVYHGSKEGINPAYKQKLLGSSVDSGLRLFGSAVAGGLDMDSNGYPDIAVGAYGSNRAVLFRTRSIVNVEGSIQLSRNQIVVESNDSLCRLEGQYHKCLNLLVCFTNKDSGLTSYAGNISSCAPLFLRDIGWSVHATVLSRQQLQLCYSFHLSSSKHFLHTTRNTS